METDIEDIEQLIEFFKFWNSHGWIPAVDTKRVQKLKQMLENILADRERLKKENKQMQIEIAEQVYFGSIPTEEEKQLQDKANKYDSLVEKIKQTDEDIANMKVEGDVFKTAVNFTRKTLQELLKEKE